eukprot:TRINITY_DN11454_c0_g1_i1.p1 TRINITY_DN11454_c0_g1~~TRINITY_DN11454_c0_g1_i1.p1  ORF type:complete len:1003 (-),score=206.27 TRINITY_DN11454_c0_g1_i1:78-3086(-)
MDIRSFFSKNAQSKQKQQKTSAETPQKSSTLKSESPLNVSKKSSPVAKHESKPPEIKKPSQKKSHMMDDDGIECIDSDEDFQMTSKPTFKKSNSATEIKKTSDIEKEKSPPKSKTPQSKKRYVRDEDEEDAPPLKKASTKPVATLNHSTNATSTSPSPVKQETPKKIVSAPPVLKPTETNKPPAIRPETPPRAIVKAEHPTKSPPSHEASPSKASPQKHKASDELPSTQSVTPKASNPKMAYHAFMSRGAPPKLGQKPLPVGQPNCLQGIIFLVTGVLESLEREDAHDLIKKYGGKITKSVTKSLTHVVKGEGAGESKLSKLHSGIVVIDEDGLFDMIESLPAGSSSELGHESSTKKPALDQNSTQAQTIQPALSPSKRDKSPQKSLQSTPTKAITKPTNLSEKFDEPQTHVKKEQNVALGQPHQVQKSTPVAHNQQTSIERPSSTSQPASPSAKIAIRPQSHESELWTTKYAPKSVNDLVGNPGPVKTFSDWLKSWQTAKAAKKDGFKNAALISGPPGIGKTTAAHLIIKACGFESLEFNASDTRSKNAVQMTVGAAMFNGSLGASADTTKLAKTVVVMDEVDGMSGADRGGIATLIDLIKKTKVPVVCICNDYYSPKVRSLANHCLDLRFHRPTALQIVKRLSVIVQQEKIYTDEQSLMKLAESNNKDIRQILNYLQMFKLKSDRLTFDAVKESSTKKGKDIQLGLFELGDSLFNARDYHKLSLRDRIDYFMMDYSTLPLFVQENYLSHHPVDAKDDNSALELVWNAAESISKGDLVENLIRRQQQWGLLPQFGVTSAIVPGYHMRGTFVNRPEFPKFLGKLSNLNKNLRLLKEAQIHMTAKVSCDKNALRLDYFDLLRNQLVTPLASGGVAAIDQVMETMDTYGLTKDDVDSFVELGQFPGPSYQLPNIATNVKSAFTRKYNQTHNKAATRVSGRAITASLPEDEVLAAEDAEITNTEVKDEESDEEDISKDKNVKVSKKKPASSTTKKPAVRGPAKGK